MTGARELIKVLQLEPHPEGGWYRQTFVSPSAGTRAASTAIYYLLEAGQHSHWHRVDADEVWHFYAGAPLELRMSKDGVRETRHVLGSDVLAGQHPQIVVPAGAWQSACSNGSWTLVGCTVAPGFTFDGFELAPPDWRPGR